jgi:hypothetical protein
VVCSKALMRFRAWFFDYARNKIPVSVSIVGHCQFAEATALSLNVSAPNVSSSQTEAARSKSPCLMLVCITLDDNEASCENHRNH